MTMNQSRRAPAVCMGTSEPSSELPERVIRAVTLAARRRAFLRIWGMLPVFLLSAFGAFFATQYTLSELSQSGFSSYLALLVSDGTALFAYWKELGITLAESLPLVGVTAFLAAVCVLLPTARFVMLDIRNIRNTNIRLA